VLFGTDFPGQDITGRIPKHRGIRKKYTQLQTVAVIASFYESEIGNGIIIAEEPVKSIQMF